MNALKALLQFEKLVDVIDNINPFPLSDKEWERVCDSGSWLMDQLNQEEKKIHKEIGELKKQRNLVSGEIEQKIKEKISAVFR